MKVLDVTRCAGPLTAGRRRTRLRTAWPRRSPGTTRTRPRPTRAGSGPCIARSTRGWRTGNGVRKSPPHRRSSAGSRPLSRARRPGPVPVGPAVRRDARFRADADRRARRHRGNSTCVFTTAAQAFDARVVSLCLSSAGGPRRGRASRHLVPPSWLSHLEAREEDIAAADFEAIVGDATRVLILWDAHGYHIAEHVLGRLLPWSPTARTSSSRTTSATSATRRRRRVRRPLRPVARQRLVGPARPPRTSRQLRGAGGRRWSTSRRATG